MQYNTFLINNNYSTKIAFCYCIGIVFVLFLFLLYLFWLQLSAKNPMKINDDIKKYLINCKARKYSWNIVTVKFKNEIAYNYLKLYIIVFS